MAEILLLGEDRQRAWGVRSLLREDGHAVYWHPMSHDWREAERDLLPELVVAPAGSAEAVLSAPGRPIRGFPAPVLLVQEGEDLLPDVRVDDRLVDRIESPFAAEELLGRVDALVRLRRVVLWGRPDRAPLACGGAEGPAGTRRWRRIGSRIAARLRSRIPSRGKPAGPYLEVASRAADWADRRDAFEPGHAERVASFSAMIADGLDLSDGEAASLLRAAMLHDLGKVALPVEVLTQAHPLDTEQKRLIRTHAERGATLLRALDPDEDVARAILYHHERWDGSGYYGKSGEEIPRASRILAVAEAFDAMTSFRLRPAKDRESALAEIRGERGAQFDAQAADALCEAMRPRRPFVALSPLPTV